MDLPNATKNLEEFKEKLSDDNIRIIPISSYTRNNLDELLYTIADTLETVSLDQFMEDFREEVVEYKFVKEETPYVITREDDGVYNVTGPMIQKFFDACDFSNEENAKLFARRIRNLGVDNDLRKLGVGHGDTVRILGYEFEFFD